MSLLTTLDLCYFHDHIVLIVYLRLIKKIEKSENKFNDNFRVMQTSRSYLVNDLCEINKKEPINEFTDSFRSMQTLLSHLANYLSVINNKKKELENEFIDKFRIMLASLSCLVDRLIKNYR